MPTVTPQAGQDLREDAEEMLRFDLDNENETIRNYRERVRQCEALGEYALAEQIREILVAGAGAPDRPGDRAGHRRAEREQRRAGAQTRSRARQRPLRASGARSPTIAASRT